MTAEELRKYFNTNYGMGIPFPKTYKVDAETYGNVCQELIKHHIEHEYFYEDLDLEKNMKAVTIVVGPNNGIMFKGVELILAKDTNSDK